MTNPRTALVNYYRTICQSIKGVFTSSFDIIIEQSFSILLKESQIPYLKNAKKVIFAGSFETFGAGSSKAVTLYDYYGLSVKLAGNAEVNSKGFLK
jgi:hypothetical protein